MRKSPCQHSYAANDVAYGSCPWLWPTQWEKAEGGGGRVGTSLVRRLTFVTPLLLHLPLCSSSYCPCLPFNFNFNFVFIFEFSLRSIFVALHNLLHFLFSFFFFLLSVFHCHKLSQKPLKPADLLSLPLSLSVLCRTLASRVSLILVLITTLCNPIPSLLPTFNPP